MTLLMTQTEFAQHRGVQKSAVSNWKSAGHLVWGEDPASGKLKIDVHRTEARLNSRIDPTRGRPTTGQTQGALFAQPASGPDEGLSLPPARDPAPRGDDLSNVRTDLLREQMVGKRFDNAERARALVAKAEYETRLENVGRQLRERMHAMGRRLSERLAAERDPRTISSLISEQIDAAFAALADQVEAGDAGDDEANDAALDAELATSPSPAALPEIAEEL